MITTLDSIHRRIVNLPLTSAFTTLTRVLLAIGFIPPGLTKLLGTRFTLIPAEASAIGLFFEGFFQSGEYYGFVGLMQVVAGVLLLVPRTALLGALIYLPIIGNIFVITVAMGFQGTWVIAGLMLLADVYLLAWDYDRLRTVLFRDPPPLPSDHRPPRRGLVARLRVAVQR